MREGQRITFRRRRMHKCSSRLARKKSLRSFLTIRTAVVVDLEGIMLSTSSDRVDESIVEGRGESISAPCPIPALSISVVVLFQTNSLTYVMSTVLVSFNVCFRCTFGMVLYAMFRRDSDCLLLLGPSSSSFVLEDIKKMRRTDCQLQ
jgi:hypothetical protein